MKYPFIKEKVFKVQPLKAADDLPWPGAKRVDPWSESKKVEIKSVQPIKSEQQFNIPNEENKKKEFGIELAKSPNNPFEAACRVFTETKIALWVSRNWLNDPVVIGAKDLYGETVNPKRRILDKEELASKVLELAEDQFLEGKDRVAALKLYSEIAGYTGKVEIDASTKNFLTRNEMKVVFVKADNEQTSLTKTEEPAKIIEHEEVSPIKIKLVKSS